jgi:hypothetical protein
MQRPDFTGTQDEAAQAFAAAQQDGTPPDTDLYAGISDEMHDALTHLSDLLRALSDFAGPAITGPLQATIPLLADGHVHAVDNLKGLHQGSQAQLRDFIMSGAEQTARLSIVTEALRSLAAGTNERRRRAGAKGNVAPDLAYAEQVLGWLDQGGDLRESPAQARELAGE